MKLGVFGGSFDPVHYGHLILAETCREECGLDEVWFLPAATPPHKQDREITAAELRKDMLQLAIGGHNQLRVSSLEIDRGGISYTVDTLRLIKEERPDAELFLLIGADTLCDLPNWHKPADVCELATPIVVRRHGSPEPDLAVLSALVSQQRLEAIRQHQLQTPTIELSSTDLRLRARDGRSLRYRTPRAVEQFILANRLYCQIDSD